MMNFYGQDMPCINSAFAAYNVPAQQSFTVAPYSLLEAVYTFVVTASTSDGQTATATAVVTMVADGAPASAVCSLVRTCVID